MRDRLIEGERGGLVLSTDRSRVDVGVVLAMLLGSHWGGAMTPERLELAMENSICVGVYEGATQLAFARVVTDLATYAYLTDVIVDEAARGRGIGSWLVESILQHPDLQGLRRIALFTRDARALYERFGFTHGPAGLRVHGASNPSVIVSTSLNHPRRPHDRQARQVDQA